MWSRLAWLPALLACSSNPVGPTGDASPGGVDAASTLFDAPAAVADASTSPSPTMSFFVTSEGGSGDLGGVDGADARCQRLATAVGQGGKTWRAYLSVDSSGPGPAVDARDRIGKGPWFNYAGVKIADNIDDLLIQDPTSPRNNLRKDTALDEKGHIVPGRGDSVNQHDILTGTSMEGRAITGATCGNWTSATNGHARVGHHDRVGTSDTPEAKSWSTAHDTNGVGATPAQGCSSEAFASTGGNGRIYCFVAN